MPDIIPEGIIRRAQGGDMEAFERIYKAVSGLVYNVVYRIMDNAEDAEDVTQEVFMKIYGNLKGFRFGSSIKTWAYRIAVNTSLNAARKRGRVSGSVSAGYDDGIGSHASINTTGKEIERRDAARAVSAILKVLNPGQRACVVLKDIEGLSYREIAQALNININTVRSRLNRARERLTDLKRKGEL